MYLLPTPSKPTPQAVRGAPQARELLAAAEAAERAANSDSEEERMRAVMLVLQYKEQLKLGLLQQQMQRIAPTHRAQDRLALEVDGDYFGRVEARVPKDLAWHLMQQKNFGQEGFYSDEGMRDLKKAYPQVRVNTISGKTVVASRQADARKRVVFGRGTLVGVN